MQTDLDGDSAWEIFVAVKETRRPIQCVPRIVCGGGIDYCWWCFFNCLSTVDYVCANFRHQQVNLPSHRLPGTPWAFCERHKGRSTAPLLSSIMQIDDRVLS